MNKNDILAQLQAGKSVDEIAKELTSLLNDAQKEKDRLDAEAKKKAEAKVAAKKAAEAKKAEELAYATQAADAMNAYYEFIYGADNFEPYTAEEIMTDHGSSCTKDKYGEISYTCTKDGKTTSKTIPLYKTDFDKAFTKAMDNADAILRDWVKRFDRLF